MLNEPLKKQIYEVLKTGYFNGPDDAVEVSVGPGEETLHLVIVSRKFDGKRL